MTLELTKLLSNTKKPLGTILHIGAGAGANLQELQRAKPRAITLVELNEIHTHFIEQTFYLPAAGEAKDLAISVTTTAETGSILKDDSWWAVEKVYN